MRSLTQAEAKSRSALISVTRYDIRVDLTGLLAGPQVRCVSTVTFGCRTPGADTFVDCCATVLAATLNGRALAPAEDGRIALTGLAEHNELVVETVQADTDAGEGVHKAVDAADGAVYVWTSFEPDEARHVWACFDQPDLKAPHAFTVLAPREWTVLSNAGTALIEARGTAREWTFPDTPPLSTYNTVVNAGPFVEIRRVAAGHDLGLYARRSIATILERDAEEIFTLTEQGFGFFERVFGMPFPQHRYDQVFAPEFGGAMENYGCVTWSDSFLRRTPPTAAERELLAKYLLHEMAHMWFGNIVTMQWWDDLWLNEAFAEFAANWAAVSVTAYTDAWAGHLAGGKLKAYLADQGPNSHPIRQPIHDVAQAASIFDAITYPKGASVLRQLMTYVGEDDFAAGMATYFARHAWGNTTLPDLIDALTTASGRDLDAWCAGWLETAGTDRLALHDDGTGRTLLATGPDGPPRPQVLAIGAYSGRQRTALVSVEIGATTTSVTLPDAEMYLVNDDDLTFATTRPDAGSWAKMVTGAGGLPTAISRGVAVAMVWDMLVNDEARAADLVSCLTGVLATETAATLIEPYLALAVDAIDLWAPDTDRTRLAATLAATCRTLAADTDQRRAALRALARTAGNLDEVADLRTLAGDDVDLQWRALIRRAELGGDTVDGVTQLLKRDPDPDARLRALAVRAATPDAADKAAVWQALMVDLTVPIGYVNQIASAFWRPGRPDLLAPYPARYLDLLPGMHQGGMTPAMVFTERMFPVFAVDRAFLGRLDEAAGSAAPVVRTIVRERADVVRRMVRARGK